MAVHGTYGSLFHRIALRRLEPENGYKCMPFDMYCPSVKEQIPKRVCSSCGKYFASQAAVHQTTAINQVDATPTDPDTEVNQIEQRSADITDNSVVIIRNLFDWLQSEFTAG